MASYKPYATAFASLLLGYGSLILLSGFLFLGSFSIIPLGLEPGRALVLDAGLSLLFFAQHSLMIRRGMREKLSRLVPEVYYSALYSIASGTTLLIVIIFWQKAPTAAIAEGMFRPALRALFFLTLAGFAWGSSSLGSFDPLGVKQIKRHINHKETRPMPMIVRGAYQWVRHPLYLFCLIMIWACPDLTWDRLLFNVMWSAWIIIATFLEERDLVRDFGDQYRAYQAKVPMLLPYKSPEKR